MASGTLNLIRSGSGYLTGRVVWSSASNGTAANTSTVTAQLQIQRSALNATTGTFTGTLTVGSLSEKLSWYGTLPSNTWVTVKTLSATVSHNNDGTGNCYLYAIVHGPTDTTMEGTNVSGSTSVVLDRIPRYASLLSVTNFTDEGNPTITYSNPAGHEASALKACISLTGEQEDIPFRDLPKTGTRYVFPLTEEERNLMRAATRDSNSLKVRVYLRSTVGGSTVYASKNATMRIVNAEPIVKVTVVDINDRTVSLTGDSSALVALHSIAQVSIQATPKKSATIVSKKVEHGGKTLTGNGIFSPVVNHPIKVTVTDSRGNTTIQYPTNRMIPYFNPTCMIGNNMPGTDGTFALTVSGRFYGGEFGKTLTVQYRYKTAGGSYPDAWTTFSSVTKDGNDYTATANLTGFDYQTVYTVQARVIDPPNPSGVYAAEKSVSAKPVFDWGQYDFQFNVPIRMAGNRITNLGDSTAPTDAVSYGQVNALTINNNALVIGNYIADVLGVDLNHPDSIMNRSGYFTNSSTNCPPNTAFGVRDVYFVSAGFIIVEARCFLYDSRSTIYRRTYNANVGNWLGWEEVQSYATYHITENGEYEYQNPPMHPGEEYRTTERYDGKPVYAKAFYFSALGAAYSSVGVAITSGTITIVSLEGVAENNGTEKYPFPLIRHDTNGVVIGRLISYVTDGTHHLYVRSFADNLTAWKARVIVKYTKG